MQLDLFAHSRDVMLRNRAINALRARDIGAARKALAALASKSPDDLLLAPAAILVESLRPARKRFADTAAAALAAAHVLVQIEPAAQQVFGAAMAPAWLRPLWQALAEAAACLPYDSSMPSAYAADMQLRAGNWTAAEEAVGAIESWRRIPVPLAWMAEARFAQHGLESAWPLLAELAWLDPARFGALALRLDTAGLKRLLRAFDRDFATGGDADLAWFPAWALISDPCLAEVLREAGTPAPDDAEQAAHVLMQLLVLERQGRQAETVERRRKLRGLHEALFAHYMQTRE